MLRFSFQFLDVINIAVGFARGLVLFPFFFRGIYAADGLHAGSRLVLRESNPLGQYSRLHVLKHFLGVQIFQADNFFFNL